MPRKECIAMLLAGGQGSRLRMLTKNLAKPAVPFGGQYRIIDFSLSNCLNSGIDTVGVLTQYKPQFLNSYICKGSAWNQRDLGGGVTILPPYMREDGGHWYNGTAHAVYQNLDFIEMHQPEYVLILSGDHIYKMDYATLLEYHKSRQAEVTIAVIPVVPHEASRFGIMNTSPWGEILEFEEKPAHPKSNLASMGVYVFNRDILTEYLKKDAQDPASDNDFGKNVIPLLLQEKRKVFAYRFSGYWKDVGTVDSYWAASMDILQGSGKLDLFDNQWSIYSYNPPQPPHFLGCTARIRDSLISGGCLIEGEVEHSLLFPGTRVGPGSVIRDSVLLSGVRVEANSRIEKAIIGEHTVVGEGSIIGSSSDWGEDLNPDTSMITVVEDRHVLPAHTRIGVLLKIKRAEPKPGDAVGLQRG